MRRIPLLIAIAACAVTALPASALAGEQTNGRSFPYDVTAEGTIKESWRVDRDLISDGCGRHTTGSGTATLHFKTPKPHRLTLGAYTGFHSKPPVDVTVDRQGTVSTTAGEDYADCTNAPVPGSAGCGLRSFKSRVVFDTRDDTWGPTLTKGDEESYDDPGNDCPLPGMSGDPKGFGQDYGNFETINVLPYTGPTVNIHRLLFGGCDGRGKCKRAKKRNVIHYTTRVAVPYFGFGQEHGEYVAEIDWTVTFRARYKLPGY